METAAACTTPRGASAAAGRPAAGSPAGSSSRAGTARRSCSRGSSRSSSSLTRRPRSPPVTARARSAGATTTTVFSPWWTRPAPTRSTTGCTRSGPAAGTRPRPVSPTVRSCSTATSPPSSWATRCCPGPLPATARRERGGGRRSSRRPRWWRSYARGGPEPSRSSTRRRDVLVEPEHVRRVVAVLQGHEPVPFLRAEPGPDLVVVRDEVEVHAARRERLHRVRRAADPLDVRLVAGRIRPGRDRVEHVVRVAVRERRRLVGDALHGARVPEDDHLRRQVEAGRRVLRERVDGAVAQLREVLAAPVVPHAVR